MKFTHAIVAKMPDKINFDDKKVGTELDLSLAKKQLEELCETLREAGVELIELQEQENANTFSFFIDDFAVVINGTALITRPKNLNSNSNKFYEILKTLTWCIVETPINEHGKPVVLEGSDILFTGKEIFVGIRKNGTNVEGALVVAKVFVDFSVIPVPVNGNLPLKYYISVVSPEILTVSKSKESQSILKKIERDATYRYNVLSLENDDSVNCLNVNNHLIFRLDSNEMKFRLLQPPTELWGVRACELLKIGSPLSKYCLLVNRLKSKTSQQNV